MKKEANRDESINQVKIILTLIFTADGTPETKVIPNFCSHGFTQGSSVKDEQQCKALRCV